jgi:HAMP domain-containing protein
LLIVNCFFYRKLGGQALVLDVEGTWRELTGVVNKLAANLTSQVRSIAKVTKAVALGDLSKQIEVDARGEILDLKNTVNGMVVRLRALAAEVTRVTLEVGSQRKLGGQAHVPDVEGVWLNLVRNVSVFYIYRNKFLFFNKFCFCLGLSYAFLTYGSCTVNCSSHHCRGSW